MKEEWPRSFMTMSLRPLLRLLPEDGVEEHLVPIGWSKRAGTEVVAKDLPWTPRPALDTREGGLGSGCMLMKSVDRERVRPRGKCELPGGGMACI